MYLRFRFHIRQRQNILCISNHYTMSTIHARFASEIIASVTEPSMLSRITSFQLGNAV